MRVAVRVLGAGLACFAGAVATAATLTVTNAFEPGAGPLRQAILDSNASPGTLDTIAFNIPGVGPFVPANPVRRDQMAVFLLKAKYGPTGSRCTGSRPSTPER